MIKFDEENHKYFDEETGRVLISVTQLLKKHFLSPDYGEIPTSILEKKATRGTLIHKELSDFILKGEIGFTNELLLFMDYAKENNLRFLESEKLVYNDIVAGILDFAYEKDGVVTLSDFKTTYTLHKETVIWQVSIYAYLYEKLFNKHIDRISVFWFKNENEMEEIELPRKSNEEIERLLDCERNGEIYKQDLKPYSQEIAMLSQLEMIIKECEEQKKQAEEQAKTIKDKLMQAMEESATVSLETDNVKITYVGATTRTTVDSARLKVEQPEIYNQYLKQSQVKPSLKITWRKQK